MINRHLKDLNKIEFVVTRACTGKCKHCSQGNHRLEGPHIDSDVATRAVKAIAAYYPIKTVMTFGGEPLLFWNTVCFIHGAARDAGIPHRQVITNGFFTRREERMRMVAFSLAESGVNDLRVSADAFHQETIPLSMVMRFAIEAKKAGINVFAQPAWVEGKNGNNPYDIKTRKIMEAFNRVDIPAAEGNIIFPEGNALVHLGEYFVDRVVENPYKEDLKNIRCISISENGETLGGNIYKQNVLDILKKYKP